LKSSSPLPPTSDGMNVPFSPPPLFLPPGEADEEMFSPSFSFILFFSICRAGGRRVVRTSFPLLYLKRACFNWIRHSKTFSPSFFSFRKGFVLYEMLSPPLFFSCAALPFLPQYGINVLFSFFFSLCSSDFCFLSLLFSSLYLYDLEEHPLFLLPIFLPFFFSRGYLLIPFFFQTGHPRQSPL